MPPLPQAPTREGHTTNTFRPDTVAHAGVSFPHGRAALGYGAFLALNIGSGTAASLGLDAPAGSWTAFSWCLPFTLGTALGSLALHVRSKRRDPRAERIWLCRAHGLVAVLLVALCALAWAETAVAFRWCCVCVLGVVYALPLVEWVRTYVDLSRACGRASMIAGLALSGGVAALLRAAFSLLATSPFATMTALLTTTACSWACQRTAATAWTTATPAGHTPRGERYRLTTYAAFILICLGVSWGMDGTFTGLTHIDAETLSGIQWAIGPLAATFIALVARIRHRNRIARFGDTARITLVVTALSWGFAPLFQLACPTALGYTLQAAHVLLSVTMAAFSIEICQECPVDEVSAISANYALFALAGCLGTVACATTWHWLDPTVAIAAMSALGILATASVITFLPTRASGASAFTLGRLPENETPEERAARRRGIVADDCNLTARERQVMELLLAGLSRNQIASKLELSMWTVKDHIANIYGKTGVHSVPELMLLVAADGE